MATTYLNSPNGTGTDPQIATFSMWFKLTKPEANEVYLFSGGDGGSNNSWLRVQGNSGKLYFRNRTSSSNDCVIQTEANHLDQNGWYHVVLKLNSTLSTVADRAIMYINGQEVTTYASSTDMTQNNLFHMFGATTTHIGKRVNDGSTGYIGGFLASHVHFCDGYAYDASAFGSTDSTTGEWKINTSPSVTYGTRGFFILKDGNSLTDQSTNTNNFTVGGGTLTKTEDNPSNVFATLNPLDNFYDNVSTLTNGNTTYATSASSGNYTFTPATLGFNSGKFYWEQKITSNVWMGSGISSTQSTGIANYLGQNTNDYAYYGHPYATGVGSKWTGGTKTNFGANYTTNDILMYAVDCDNLKIYTGKNGTWNNSGDPTSGSTGTGAMYTITNPSLTQKGFYFPSACTYDTLASGSNFNFGNGFFGTTQISSAGSNASGIGIFEYNVPAGFTALSTKGLNT
jgi:hypothetical protein